MHKSKINGVWYEVEMVDGEFIYNPPLPATVCRNGIKEIIESGEAPYLKTSSTFFAGRGSLLHQMEGDDDYTDFLVRKAREDGYTPSPGDVYLGQVAEKVGDKEAWFKPGDGEQQVKRVLERKAARREKNKKEAPRLNPNLVDEIAVHYRNNNMVDRKVSDGELRQIVIDNHGRKD
jgi:hypothetical protein